MSVIPAPLRPGFIVAILVRDEEERLPACLRALARQRDRLGQAISPMLVRVVLFANNCADRSASLARKLEADLSLDVRVVEARLPPATAHAGAARRAAMELVEAGGRDGVILTTDADSQVAPNWIAENLAAFAAGAEAVLVRIDLGEEAARLPEALHRRGELETRMRDCSRNCPGYLIRWGTIPGPTTRQSRAQALASIARPIAALAVCLASPWARTKR
jgi:glycosyltransferase involved in cell wall biosynthesis